MAVLKESVGGGSSPFRDKIGDKVAPAGTFVARIIDIKDEFGVMRKKFESEELVKQDVTTFLFGFRDQAGQPHMVDSKTHPISGNEKSGLFKMLRGILGTSPKYGWDYCELKGTKCLITVDHKNRTDGSGVFVCIASLSPLPAGFVPPAYAPAAAPAGVQAAAQPVAHSPVQAAAPAVYAGPADEQLPF